MSLSGQVLAYCLRGDGIRKADEALYRRYHQSLCRVGLPKGPSELTVHMPTFFSVIARLLHV